MNNIRFYFILFFIIIVGEGVSQVGYSNPEKRILDLNIVLQTIKPSQSNVLNVVRVGNLLYLSGQVPVLENGILMKGKVGKEIDLMEAQNAARIIGIKHLEILKGELGSLNKVVKIVKVLGMVNAVPTFDMHPEVIN